ncbi:Wzz/FepE/Etk N-terminal domain-containing protein [Rossellomorea marisflavi]|uniref:YveK family protein n=1 Tax=Rossellomorea marisflavi TaxID=189381 RepID=UPI00279CD1B1|nr:Wzz/FepE/Etk N-terminal domain-containing protein [Rossellomorea marisflavi]UTE73400.1 Wzz/FepE/Etk N-terminal domain-containing protein [Rossellomorea marisflavi]
MEETISLRELMQTLRKRMSLIILITLTAILVSGGVSFFLLTPVYESSTQLLVNQSKSDQSAYNNPGQIQTNLQLINTYKEIITSPVILDKVSEDLGMSTGDIQSKITVSNQSDSQVVRLAVQDTDPAQAAQIANKTAEVFQKDIPDIMNVDNVTILTKADVGQKQSPVKPKPLLNIAIAMVVGLMIGVGISFLLEFLDNTIKTEQDVEKVLGVPVLGSIAKIGETKAEKKFRNTEERGERIG